MKMKKMKKKKGDNKDVMMELRCARAKRGGSRCLAGFQRVVEGRKFSEGGWYAGEEPSQIWGWSVEKAGPWPGPPWVRVVLWRGSVLSAPCLSSCTAPRRILELSSELLPAVGLCWIVR